MDMNSDDGIFFSCNKQQIFVLQYHSYLEKNFRKQPGLIKIYYLNVYFLLVCVINIKKLQCVSYKSNSQG